MIMRTMCALMCMCPFTQRVGMATAHIRET